MAKNKATVMVKAILTKNKNNDFDAEIIFVTKFANDKPLKKSIVIKNIIKNKPDISNKIFMTGMKLCEKSPSYKNFNIKN